MKKNKRDREDPPRMEPAFETRFNHAVIKQVSQSKTSVREVALTGFSSRTSLVWSDDNNDQQIENVPRIQIPVKEVSLQHSTRWLLILRNGFRILATGNGRYLTNDLYWKPVEINEHDKQNGSSLLLFISNNAF